MSPDKVRQAVNSKRYENKMKEKDTRFEHEELSSLNPLNSSPRQRMTLDDIDKEPRKQHLGGR